LVSAGRPDTSRFHGLSAGKTLQLPSEPFWAHVSPPDGAVVVVTGGRVVEVVVLGVLVVVVAGLVVVVTGGFVVVVGAGRVVVGAGGAGAGAGRHADNTSAPTATVTRKSRPRRMWWYRHPGCNSLKQGWTGVVLR
jgi:hypothetical protein